MDRNRDGILKWYISLRRNLICIITAIVIEGGDKLQEKSELIGRNLLCKISRALLLRNDIESVEMRASFCTDYNSCGRTGEIATSYGTAFWDDVQGTFKTDWRERFGSKVIVFVY
jgi:hypothetical protein